MSDTKSNDDFYDTICTIVYSSKDHQSLHKSLNGQFILYQLLIDYLLDDKTPFSKAKPALYQYFKPDNQFDQRILKEFDKEYTSDKAIYWYTRDASIYKFLNKALRLQNLDDVVAFAALIRDIDKQLKEEYKSFVKTKKTSIIQVYRGQLIHKDEINRLKANQGQLISMNSFLSTSANREKALHFTVTQSPPTEQLTAILFEIYANIQSPSRPLADIKHLRGFSDDEEVLFMFGCVFRLDDIWFDEQLKIWRGKLTLCGDNDSDMKDFLSTLNKELSGRSKLISFGTYLIQMQKYQQAQEHFEKLLENKSFNDPTELAHCHYGLFQINYVKAEYKSAINNLNKTLDCLVEYSEQNEHPLICQALNDLGRVYAKQKEYILSIHFYNKALKTIINDCPTTYSGLAHVYFELEDYYLALECLQKALDNQPSSAYGSIADTYISMAKAYAKISQQGKALDMYDKALESQLKIFGSNHPDLSYTYTAIGLMYSDLGNHDKALELVDKAYHIQVDSLPNHHSDFTKTFQHFGDLYVKKGELDKALYYFHKTVENQLKIFAWNHPKIAESYRLIGDIYLKKKDYDRSISHIHQVLLNEIDRFTFGNPILSDTFKLIADIYFEKKDFDHALQYYHKSLENELVKKLPEDISLIPIYKVIAKLYYKKRSLSQALLYYNRLLNCHLRRQPFNQSVLFDIYKKIGKVYLRKRHFDETLLLYDKSRIRPGKNKSTMEIYKDIDNVHFERQHLDESLFYFERYLEQLLKENTPNEVSINRTYFILGNISLEKQKYDKALNYFTLLLNTELKKKYFNDPSLTKIYKFLGNITYKLSDYNESLSHFYRLIDCITQRRPLEDTSVINTYGMIGKIFLKKHYQNQIANYFVLYTDQSKATNPIDVLYEKYHLDQTLTYFKKMLDKKTSTNVFTKDSIYIIVANICLQKREPKEALRYFHSLIKLQLEKQPAGDLSTAIIYSIVGDIYFKLSDYNQALVNYQSALVIYQRLYASNHSSVVTTKYKIRDAVFPVL
ncbi:unnamed protein product [Adineta ricciae]|uniref:Nephrocystin-3 n=1 Tax=Adineta ricciae TaxID=249248 RepID=A0A816DJ49_ADIRI|nr:unnamed protein product [Adineta ricciae]CAF1634707.1 unnamed protein product [Adineta ricciae]